jgi:hypothetical protein
MFRDVEPGVKHAVLPETMDPFCIGDMQVDDVRFARPYAMRVDAQRRVWLDASHPTSPEETDHMPLMVTRTLEGYCVTVQDHPEIGWATETTQDLETLYGEDIEYIPVVHLFDPRATRRLQ